MTCVNQAHMQSHKHTGDVKSHVSHAVHNALKHRVTRRSIVVRGISSAEVVVRPDIRALPFRLLQQTQP